MKSGKWFCNGRVTGTASCIVTHLVRHAARDHVSASLPSTMSLGKERVRFRR